MPKKEHVARFARIYALVLLSMQTVARHLVVVKPPHPPHIYIPWCIHNTRGGFYFQPLEIFKLNAFHDTPRQRRLLCVV